MACDVFNRYEQKYLVDAEFKMRICEFLSQKMIADACNPEGQTYSINNIYFDDKDFTLIRKSLSKPLYKEKLRLRSYGIPDNQEYVYLEIKKKFKGKVNKRRTKIKLGDAYKMLASEGREIPLDYRCNQLVLEEIQFLLQRYLLVPAWYISYDRLAFAAADKSGLRISLDCNIRWRNKNLDLRSGDYGYSLIGENQWLMEIKTPDTIPLWLSDFLSANKIYPIRFSKYGKSFLQEANNNPYISVPASVRFSETGSSSTSDISGYSNSKYQIKNTIY